MKRIVVVSDTHCGHQYGLTPTKWNYRKTEKPGRQRKLMWDWYRKMIKSLQPIDILVANGDLIDGTGKRSGGTELLTTDRIEQCEMALEVLGQANAKTYRFTFGTGYHTGDIEDFEKFIVSPLGGTIEAEQPLEILGTRFLFRHHMHGGASDQSALTAPFKFAIDDIQRSARNKTKTAADIYVFSHRHRTYLGWLRGLMAVGTPCLQGESKYGVRRIGNHVDIGLVYFDVEEGITTWPNIELLDAKHTKRVYEQL